ncbi:MAG: hypothetical protein ACRDYA_02045 [Egibacteraceae bacterium]
MRRHPPCTACLGAYRRITHLGGLTLACEVCDWRRFGRAGVFMGFVGLVPSELLLGPGHPPAVR